MKLKGILLSLLILSTVALGGENKVAFSLRGGYYLPISTTFNDEYIPAVKANLNDLNSYFTEMGLTGSFTELPKFRGSFIFG
ncbi:MAG: hypothetical protein ACPLRA_07420, partial [Candidatus Saccharicenans sp.]